MDSNPYRPRVSRETRLLLTTAVLAMTALWLLARIRFPDRPVSPNPVQPLLTQLASGPSFSDLAAEVTLLEPRVRASLLALDLDTGGATPERRPALRVRDDVVVMVTPLGGHSPVPPAAVRDPASGLTVVLMPPPEPATPVSVWSPTRLEQARYLMATDMVNQSVVLRPVFVAALVPIEGAAWTDPVWSLPAGANVTPGAFLFTNNAELVGMVVELGGSRVVLPGATLVSEVARLLETPRQPPGEIGIQVQPLTPSIAAATGAAGGIVVRWVDPKGASAGKLAVGDVIEGAGGHLLATTEQWEVRASRLVAGETLPLLVRRNGMVVDVDVPVLALATVAATTGLGLVLRGVDGRGAEVVRVAPGSAADRAGLAPGDLITLVANVSAPTPADVVSAFAGAREGRPLLLAVTRGDGHRVLTLAQ
jgi:hypothetical protein